MKRTTTNPAPSRKEYQDGSTAIYEQSTFAKVVELENCRCEDGERRRVFVTGKVSLYEAIPNELRFRTTSGYTRTKGKKISGFYVMVKGSPLFMATGKNAALIERTRPLTSWL